LGVFAALQFAWAEWIRAHLVPPVRAIVPLNLADIILSGLPGGAGPIHLRDLISYEPASRFWALQWVETGIFLALALALAGCCLCWLIRRIA
jgi:hypothetical protein